MIKENTVPIHFSKPEYKTLIQALALASWVLHAHAEEERKDTRHFRTLEQKILALSKDMGMEKDIAYDPKLEEYLPTREFEDGVLHYIDEYNEDTFWEELIERLVLRDLALKVGGEGLGQLSFEERFQKEDPIRVKYENEFEKNGIDNLTIAS